MAITDPQRESDDLPAQGPAPDQTDLLDQTDQPQLQEDLLIEDVSIDGMCGVY